MLREFFSNHLAKCIVDDRKQDAVLAKNIWKKYVKEGTEIYKEMSLAKILLETKFTNQTAAQKFMDNIIEAAANIDNSKLDKEKTALIREINSKIGTEFFDYTLSDYTNLASVHIALNEWMD